MAHLSFAIVLMAVEPATLENGCLEVKIYNETWYRQFSHTHIYFQVVAGSHQISIPMGNDVCLDDAWSEKQTWVSCPLNVSQEYAASNCC